MTVEAVPCKRIAPFREEAATTHFRLQVRALATSPR